jgi:predicted type IV restriction endonuclease
MDAPSGNEGVVVTTRGEALAEPSKKAPRAAPKWETDARDRIRTAIRKYAKPLADLVARDANEGDTRTLVTDFLSEGLGYDKYEDLTMEYLVKGEFADYGIRIEKQMVAFLEVKRVTTKLGQRHLRQVQLYAVNEGLEWLILTNGADWQVYHMTVTTGSPAQIDLAFDVSLLGTEGLSQRVNQLFYLSKESLKRRRIDELWQAQRATSPKSLAAVLLSDTVVSAVRKQLKRTTKQDVIEAEIKRLLRDTVIRQEALA